MRKRFFNFERKRFINFLCLQRKKQFIFSDLLVYEASTVTSDIIVIQLVVL